jgi:hypothetical protein
MSLSLAPLASGVGMILVAVGAAWYWRRLSSAAARWFWIGAGLWTVAVLAKVIIALVSNAVVIGFLKRCLLSWQRSGRHVGVAPSPMFLPGSGRDQRLMKFSPQEMPGRKFRQIGGHPDAALVELEQLDPLVALVRTQDQPDRGLLPRLHLVLLQPSEIQLHLPLVGGLEALKLESTAISRRSLR